MSLKPLKKDELIEMIETMRYSTRWQTFSYLRNENERLEIGDALAKTKIRGLETVISDFNDNQIYLKSKIIDLEAKIMKCSHEIHDLRSDLDYSRFG